MVAYNNLMKEVLMCFSKFLLRVDISWDCKEACSHEPRTVDADAGDLLVGKIKQLGQLILDVVIRTHAGSLQFVGLQGCAGWWCTVWVLTICRFIACRLK